MLHLPQVTLFAIDCFAPGRTVSVMLRSMQLVRFGAVFLLTDTRRYNPAAIRPKPEGIELVHIQQSDVKRAPFPSHPPIAVDYDRDILTKSKDYCPTGFQLMMEWDSCVLNPLAWRPCWMDYDFIGAPWVPHHDPGWPPCDETNSVGNFGFSLRSKRFLCECAEAVTRHADDPAMCNQMMSSDRFICRSVRHELAERGIKFAPEHEAAMFSCENRVYSGQFGFHGKTTAALNNWGAWLEKVR